MGRAIGDLPGADSIDQEMDVAKVLQLTAVIEREEDDYVSTCPELDMVRNHQAIWLASLTA